MIFFKDDHNYFQIRTAINCYMNGNINTAISQEFLTWLLTVPYQTSEYNYKETSSINRRNQNRRHQLD